MTKQCPFCAEEIQADAVKCKHCQTWLVAEVPGGTPRPLAGMSGFSGRLVRSRTSRVISGVCGGLGQAMGVDPTLIRVVCAVATFFTGIVPGIILYIILAVVVPSEDQPSAWTG